MTYHLCPECTAVMILIGALIGCLIALTTSVIRGNRRP